MRTPIGSAAGKWRSRAPLAVALTAALLLLCCSGGTAAYLLNGLFGENPGDPKSPGIGCGKVDAIDPNGKLPRAGSLTGEQMRNAAIIISVGQKMKVPPRGWVIAVATALQESRLVNLGHLGERNDHDSLGLFQQRPSVGVWGTPSQIMDPEHASRKFYEALLRVRGWQTMPLTVAAQTVQRSAYPNAYAKHEPLASLVVNLLAEGAARAVGELTDLRCVAGGEIAASGWTVPIKAILVSGFRTPGRPYHFGVDLAAPKGTAIHAASAGVVVVAKCNANIGSSPYSCDVDGSTSVGGCGWYVDIRHAGNVITRYCHLVARPDVRVGQQVAAGQVIGRSGSSGNSSGPHLHFEVHLNGDASNNGATDPVRFMREVGAPLGGQRP